MYKIKFSKRALKELVESYNWYEDQQHGLGDRFKKMVYQTAETAAKSPEMYAVTYKDYRQIQLLKFPFLLIFKIDEKLEIITITSVFHVKRNPASKY